jgi:hypothetical protein
MRLGCRQKMLLANLMNRQNNRLKNCHLLLL